MKLIVNLISYDNLSHDKKVTHPVQKKLATHAPEAGALALSLSLFLSFPSSQILTDFGIGAGPIGITLSDRCYCRLIQKDTTKKIQKGCLIIFDINNHNI